jgi:hypothetical protein
VKIGIVGSEGAKFTASGEAEAKRAITAIVAGADAVCSGECHLGGIDIWTHETADEQGVVFVPFAPYTKSWEGYKARNIQIAQWSDLVVCITVKQLPPGFVEHGWERFCYHCKSKEHIKSGGCWTMKYAEKLGKRVQLVVVANEPADMATEAIERHLRKG